MTIKEAKALKPLQWVKFYYDDEGTKDGTAIGIVMEIDEYPNIRIMFLDPDEEIGNRFGFFENTFSPDYIIKAGPVIVDNPPKL